MASEREVDSVSLTTWPLAIGGGLSLVIGLALEGIPHLSPTGWGVVLGLAALNTAFAYLLFNWALQELYALEANVIANLSPIGTAVLAQPILEENISPARWVSLLAIVIGASLTQLRSGRGRWQ